MKRICIVGLGNDLMGDDGVGPTVVRKLHEMGVPDRDKATGPVDLTGILRKEELIDESMETSDDEVVIEAFDAGTSMLSAIYLMDGFDEAIVVDAIDFGGKIGEVVTFDPDEVESAGTGISLHSFDVIETIKMMRQLDELSINRITIVAVQPEAVCRIESLSQSVADSIPDVLRSVVNSVFHP
jgi:hydrogenase maturation protease